MHSIFISLDHDDPRQANKPEDEREPCCVEYEVELGYEPGESNYGADADGNRGISIPGFFGVEGEIPTKCDECGHEFTMEELESLRKEADEKARDYEYEPDPPEPDYPEPDDYEPWV